MSSDTAAATFESPSASGWCGDILRAAGILCAAALFALLLNALSDKPVPLLDKTGPGAPPERAQRISIAALKDSLAAGKAVVLLDVRHTDSFQAAHPAQAKNAPAEEFLEYYNQLNLGALLPAAEDVVILCESEQCPSADRVAKILHTFKHNNVRVLQDGWNAWQKAGMPVEKGEP